MMVSVPNDYGYVILSVVLSVITMFVLGGRVGFARKKYNVKLPAMYDLKKPEFCGYQRGHQNALETYSAVLVMTMIGGMKYPIVVAVSMVVWCIARYSYQSGYASGKPDQRYALFGGLMYPAILIMLGSTVALAIDLIVA